MSAYQHQWYQSPLNLPACKSGNAEIRHRVIQPGERVNIVGQRQALLRGMSPIVGMVEKPLRVHELIHRDHGMWMSDVPEELNQIGELLHTVKPFGSVLIGGLGLGLLASAVAQRATVTNVTVVEKDRDVIKLCAPPNSLFDTVKADITEFLATCKPFDFFLLDTWQGTNEGTWWSQVMPMRRLIRQRFGRLPVVHCWAEDIMRGQILNSLMSKPPHWYYSGLPMPMPEREAKQFVRDVGTAAWEKRYGATIDGTMTKMKAEGTAE
jgi:hypothetical protein